MAVLVAVAGVLLGLAGCFGLAGVIAAVQYLLPVQRQECESGCNDTCVVSTGNPGQGRITAKAMRRARMWG